MDEVGDDVRRAEQAAGDYHRDRSEHHTGTHGPVRTADFWFDPSCPFTWRTSVWLREVSRRHGVDVTWRPMSLAVLNEGREVPEQYRESVRQSVRALRVLAAAGDAARGGLYAALGARWHDQGLGPGDEVLAAALADAGLPAGLADAADDEGRDAAVRASHQEGQERAGAEVGSPVLALDGGPAYFGPVVVPPPTGAEADDLFRALALLRSVPSFSELRTARAPL